MTNTAPTPRQAEVLDFIRRYWVENGRSPTIRDIVQAFGFATTNAAVCHLKPLAAKGMIEWEQETARGIWPAGWRDRIREFVETLP